MKLLLDTHVVIWALEDNAMLPEYIRDMIIDEKNEIYVSAASLWEIAIKHNKCPDKLPFSATKIGDYCQRSGYVFLSLNIDAISTLEKYDLSMHKDPFDQILVVQSVCHNMKLITHDDKMKMYGIGHIEYF